MRIAIALIAGTAIAATASAQLEVGQGTVAGGWIDAEIMQLREDGNAVLTVNLVNTESWDLQFDPSNVTAAIDINALAGLPAGSLVIVHGIAWDVTINTVGGSWLSEAYVSQVDLNGNGIYLHPGAGDNFAGTAAYNSGGWIDYTDNGLPETMLTDGVLYMEYFESFDDVADAIDAYWNGTLQYDITVVPAPASVLLLGLGLVARRRR